MFLKLLTSITFNTVNSFSYLSRAEYRLLGTYIMKSMFARCLARFWARFLSSFEARFGERVRKMHVCF